MIKTMKNFNLSLNKYIYLVYRMFGDRTWDRIGYLICIVRDRLSTDFEKLGGVTPPLMCAPGFHAGWLSCRMKPNKQKAMPLILSDVVKCVQCIYIVAKALKLV